LSAVTLLAYYGYYKWVIQDELRRYTGEGWSGAVCLLPFLAGVTLPPLLAWLDPDVPPEFAGFSLLGIIWIYIVQFKLYRTVNRLYQTAGMPKPLVVWWLFIPGLNLIVGLRQIHFLSQFWAMKHNTSVVDPIAKALPVLFATFILTVITLFSLPASAFAYSAPAPVLAMGSLFSFSGDRPTTLGVTEGSFAPCPSSPNCVSSQSRDGKHRIEPLALVGTPAETLEQLKGIITQLPRAEIIAATDSYLYAEFTSALMGFVDDVEFYVDPVENVVQVRSASRLGESDLGVNRKRIETIRQKLNGFSLAV
jgi:uncharacterized protein (DUF1499 family)